MSARLSDVERLARQLRQWEAQDTAGAHGYRYPYTTAQTWERCGEKLREAYRTDAARILRFVRRQGEESEA